MPNEGPIHRASSIAPMLDVITVLPQRLAERMKSMPQNLAIYALDPAQLRKPLAWQPSTVYVIDPCQFPEGDFLRFCERAVDTGLRAIVYSAPLPIVARLVVAAQKLMPLDVIFADTEQERQFLAIAIEALAGISVAARVRYLITQPLEHLWSLLQVECVGLFSGARIPESPEEFATFVNSRPRTIHQQLRTAGLLGIDRLCMGARFCRAWPEFANARAKLSTIAKRCGFEGIARMEYASQVLLGESPRQSANIEPGFVASKIVAGITRSQPS